MRPFSLVSLLFAQGLALVPPQESVQQNRPFLHQRMTSHGNGTNPRMPSGAWDSHHHVMDPTRYPPLPDAEYKPGVYTVWDNAIFEHRIGCEHVVMVQPSIYGYDNKMLIDSLKAYGPDRARAVVMFETANITTAQLAEWDRLGVRGVRLNFQTHGDAPPPDKLNRMLRQYADMIRPFGWAIQLYIAMGDIPAIEETIPDLGVKVVFDHFGDPDMPEHPATPPQNFNPYTLDGFGSLVRLLEQGSTWVKVSGAYRLSRLPGPEWRDIDPIVRELVRVAPSRLVYGSDWPHTRFDGLDIKPWTEHLLDMTEGNEDLKQKLFVGNAQELWSGNSSSLPSKL